jgi:hypothetical protein
LSVGRYAKNRCFNGDFGERRLATVMFGGEL